MMQETMKKALADKAKKNAEPEPIEEIKEPPINSYKIEGKFIGYMVPEERLFKSVVPPKEIGYDGPMGNQTYEGANIGQNLAKLNYVSDAAKKLRADLRSSLMKRVAQNSSKKIILDSPPKS